MVIDFETVLIETLWNVNVADIIIHDEFMGFNRNIMECKSIKNMGNDL